MLSRPIAKYYMLGAIKSNHKQNLTNILKLKASNLNYEKMVEDAKDKEIKCNHVI